MAKMVGYLEVCCLPTTVIISEQKFHYYVVKQNVLLQTELFLP